MAGPDNGSEAAIPRSGLAKGWTDVHLDVNLFLFIQLGTYSAAQIC